MGKTIVILTISSDAMLDGTVLDSLYKSWSSIVGYIRLMNPVTRFSTPGLLTAIHSMEQHHRLVAILGAFFSSAAAVSPVFIASHVEGMLSRVWGTS